MVVFSIVEYFQRSYLRHDLLACTYEFIDLLYCLLLLLFIEIKHSRQVLRSYILALTVFLSRVMNREEDVQKFLIAIKVLEKETV